MFRLMAGTTVKSALLLIGIILLSWGIWGTVEAVLFLKRSEIVQGQVTGFSSIRTSEREQGDCTAYSKGCAAAVSFTLADKTEIHSEVAQPIFSRGKVNTITLAVDPKDPQNPRIASVHVLFRNPMMGLALGLVLTLIPGLLFTSPERGKHHTT